MTSNYYARRAAYRNPKPASNKQAYWVRKLIEEKQVDPARAERWLDRLNTGDMTGAEAGDIMDELFAAKSKIVAPSTLGPQEEGKEASPKQVRWVEKLVEEKDISAEDRAAVEGFLGEGLTMRHAGRILDFLFDAADADAPRGYLGELGERIAVEGTVKTFRAVMTRYGETNLIEVQTADGKVVKAFSRNKTFAGLYEGKAVVIEGKVKGHDTYRGAEATVLRNAKIVAG